MRAGIGLKQYRLLGSYPAASPPFFQQGLLGWNHIQITIRPAVPILIVPERVTEKIQAGSCLLQINNPRFLAVQFQSPSIVPVSIR